MKIALCICLWYKFTIAEGFGTSLLFLSWIIYVDILQREVSTWQQPKINNYFSVAVISSWTYCSLVSSLSEGPNVICVANNVVVIVPKRFLHWKCPTVPVNIIILIISKLGVIRDVNSSSWAVSHDGMKSLSFPQKNITLTRAHIWRPVSLLRFQGNLMCRYKLREQKIIACRNLKYSLMSCIWGEVITHHLLASNRFTNCVYSKPLNYKDSTASNKPRIT